jgi:hypothetical protein
MVPNRVVERELKRFHADIWLGDWCSLGSWGGIFKRMDWYCSCDVEIVVREGAGWTGEILGGGVERWVMPENQVADDAASSLGEAAWHLYNARLMISLGLIRPTLVLRYDCHMFDTHN